MNSVVEQHHQRVPSPRGNTTEEVRVLETRLRMPSTAVRAVMPYEELISLGSGGLSKTTEAPSYNFEDRLRRFLAIPLTETARAFPLDVRDLSKIPAFSAKLYSAADTNLNSAMAEDRVSSIIKYSAVVGLPYLVVWETPVTETSPRNVVVRVQGKNLVMKFSENVIELKDGDTGIGNGGILLQKNIDDKTVYSAIVSIHQPTDLSDQGETNRGVEIDRSVKRKLFFECPQHSAEVSAAVDIFVAKLNGSIAPNEVHYDQLFSKEVTLTDAQKGKIVDWMLLHAASEDVSVRYSTAFLARKLGTAPSSLAIFLLDNIQEDSQGRLPSGLLVSTSLQALSSIKDASAIPMLVRYMLEGEPSQAETAACGLVGFGKQACAAASAAALIIQDETTRFQGFRTGNLQLHKYAQQILANVGSAETAVSVPTLIQKVKSALLGRRYSAPASKDDYEIGGEAALTLGSVANEDKDAVAALLVQALRTTAESFSGHSGMVRVDGVKCIQKICTGLGALGVNSSIVRQALEAVASDSFLDLMTAGSTDSAKVALTKLAAVK